ACLMLGRSESLFRHDMFWIEYSPKPIACGKAVKVGRAKGGRLGIRLSLFAIRAGWSANAFSRSIDKRMATRAIAAEDSRTLNLGIVSHKTHRGALFGDAVELDELFHALVLALGLLA